MKKLRLDSVMQSNDYIDTETLHTLALTSYEYDSSEIETDIIMGCMHFTLWITKGVYSHTITPHTITLRYQ